MLGTKTFAIVGGDLRQVHMANTLAAREDGFTIYAMFLGDDAKLSKKIHRSDHILSVLPQSDVIIFPLPMLANGDDVVNTPFSDKVITFAECLDYIPPDATVLAGKVPESIRFLAQERGIKLIDYLEREDFSVMNAVPTAEGALEIALREMPITLFGASCLITGYGRVSKALSKVFSACGAKVKVVARRYSDLAWARAYGQEAVHLSKMSEHLSQVDLLVNTVPAMILGEDKLARLKRDCLVLDLASKPGGVDFEVAKTLGIKTIWALSLPGKVAPITAAEITLEAIFNILHEEGRAL